MPRFRFHPAPLALAATLMLGAAAAQAQAPSALAATPQEFSIGAQALGPALNALARQSRLELMVQPALVAGKTAPAVAGRLTPRQALERLLAGSGLMATIEGTAVTVQRLPETSATGDYSLREVRVTGRRDGETERSGSYTTDAITVGKTAQALREHPQSVSVLTRPRLEDQNITDLGKAAEQAVGITVQDTTYRIQSIYSRGFAIDSIQLDGGAPISTGLGAEVSIDLAQYDRVEILRGAAGLLNGTGNPGGAVNLVRKMPTAKPQFSVMASAGSWDRYRAEVDASGPLAFDGKLRGRTVLGYEDRKYFTDVRATRKPLFYGVLEADVGPDAVVAIGASEQRLHERGSWLGVPRYTTGADLHLPRNTGTMADWDHTNDRTRQVFAKATWRLADRWTLRANATHSKQVSETVGGFVFGGIDPLTMTGGHWQSGNPHTTNRQTLVDVNLSGAFELLGRTHEVLAGFDAQDVRTRWVAAYPLSGNGADANTFDIGQTPFERPTFGPVERIYDPWGQKQYGAYGTLRLEVADGTKLIVGARVNRYRYNQIYKTLDTDTGIWSTAGDTQYSEPTKITPFAGLVHDINGQWSAYGSFAQIFKPQADYKAGPPPGNGLQPMRGSNVELGLKGELLDGRLNTAFALYRIVQDGRAVKDPRYNGESVLFSTNCCYFAAGKVVSEGLDIEANGEVARGVNLYAGYTYNRNSDKTAGAAFSTITPRHSLKLWSTWQLPGSAAAWKIGGGAVLQSRQYVSGSAASFNAASGQFDGPPIPFQYSQGGYAVWNALVEYRIDPSWTVALNLNNVFDKWYYRTVGSSRGGNYYGEPRAAMLTVRGRF